MNRLICKRFFRHHKFYVRSNLKVFYTPVVRAHQIFFRHVSLIVTCVLEDVSALKSVLPTSFVSQCALMTRTRTRKFIVFYRIG